jgi:hypothetical protein
MGKGHISSAPSADVRFSFTEAEVTVRNGKRFVDLTCKSPFCVAYDLPRLYDEDALEIHGTAGAG